MCAIHSVLDVPNSEWLNFTITYIASLFQALYQARSVRTIEKEGGRRAGFGKEKGEALSFTRPYPFSSPVLLVFR